MYQTIEKHLDKGMDERLLAAFRDLSLRTEGWVRKNMYDLRERATEYEIRVADYLDGLGYHFVSQAPFYNADIGAIYFADFLLPRQALIIEVDGWSHDGVPAKASDAVRDAFFKKLGYKVIRIKNSMTLHGYSLEKFIGSVLKEMRPPKAKKPKSARKPVTQDEIESAQHYEAYKTVLDSVNNANPGSVLVFRTTARMVARGIATKSGGPTKYHGLLKEISDACKERDVTILAKFDSKKAQKWMGKHLTNPVTLNFIQALRDGLSVSVDLG